MGLRAQVRGQQRLAIGATTDCVLELRDGSAVRMAPSAAQEGQMGGVQREGKEATSSAIWRQLLWALCRGKRDSYIVTDASRLSHPDAPTDPEWSHHTHEQR